MPKPRTSFCILRTLLIIGILCVGWYGIETYAQSSSSIDIHYRFGSSKYEPAYHSNGETVARFVEQANHLADTLTAGKVKVYFSASACPEGSVSFNEKLRAERLQHAIEALAAAGLDAVYFNISNLGSAFVSIAPMTGLPEMVEKSMAIDAQEKAAIMSILNDSVYNDKQKLHALKTLNGGQIWNTLAKKVFPGMRTFKAIVSVNETDSLKSELDVQALVEPSVKQSTADILEAAGRRTEPAANWPEAWRPKLTPKTNALLWGILIANAGVEIDFSRRLSLHVPVYFSAFDYFSSTIKFRTLTLQPELRWNFAWPQGLFVGVHGSICYFNLAANGNYRIQDHAGETPMLGGGLSLGYKLHFPDYPRLGVEFVIGAGAYNFEYDRFVNEENGPYVDTQKEVYMGLDNLAIGFFYEFSLGRRTRK